MVHYKSHDSDVDDDDDAEWPQFEVDQFPGNLT